MADSHYAHTVPTQRCFMTHWRGVASNFVENYSHLFNDSSQKKNRSRLTQVGHALLPNYEGGTSRWTESHWSQIVNNIKRIRAKNKSRW